MICVFHQRRKVINAARSKIMYSFFLAAILAGVVYYLCVREKQFAKNENKQNK